MDEQEPKDQQKLDEDPSDDDAAPGPENEHENEGAAEPSSSTTVSKGKKSKKSKKKGKGNKEANDIPQAVVDHVVNEIRRVHMPQSLHSNNNISGSADKNTGLPLLKH